ncbi:MAG: YidC/Oxa1 family membrane protein insertase [Clostridiales bacterium]|jgi:YidC/Oxa1 family membrane protein insertase|nr:YidC/Oxa1 family membrane protein insertase [Clostridiales bacterium]
MSSIFDFISVPFGYVVRFCYSFTHNYAVALLIFAVLIKLLLLPLSIKQQKNQVMQAKLRPKEMAIRQKYAGRDDNVTKQKVQQEVMDLYQREKFNPMGGCLPMAVELIIIWALYSVITSPLKYLCQLNADIITAITEKITELGGAANMSQIKMVAFIRENFQSFTSILPEGFTEKSLPDFRSIFGHLDLGQTPALKEPSLLWIIPIATFIIVFASMKITRKFTYQAPGTEDQMKSMKIMDFTMPLISVWITFTVPAVVGLYWIYQNILNALKQALLWKLYPVPKFTEEEIRQAQKEYNGKVQRAPAAEKPRSLHRIDDDDFPDELRKKNQNKQEKTNLIAKAELKDESDKSTDDKHENNNENKDESAENSSDE